MLFSICIPNYNYEQYVGITLESVIKQTMPPFEVLVTDNASTDKSVEVIKGYAEQHTNIKLKVNRTNIGFAGNLDEVGKMARGDWMIMLSSDDVVKEHALEVYRKFINLIPTHQNFAFCSAFEKIDSYGNFLEFLNASGSSLWNEKDIDAELSKELGISIYKVKSAEMLKRCLSKFLNPFNFAATCYTREVYEKVGGYGGGRLINPDKWFHWKIMAELDYVYYIDSPLFQYRWHQNNQAGQQQQSQILKYWLDEYRNSFELTPAMLNKAGKSAKDIKKIFNKHCILAYVIKHLKQGNFPLAKRIFAFGLFCYPIEMRRNLFYYIIGPILKITPNWNLSIK